FGVVSGLSSCSLGMLCSGGVISMTFSVGWGLDDDSISSASRAGLVVDLTIVISIGLVVRGRFLSNNDLFLRILLPTVAFASGRVSVRMVALRKGVEEENTLKALNNSVTSPLMEEVSAFMMTYVFSTTVIFAWRLGKLISL
nr:hypothetical protein [Tanacetum cinerariifolium]GFA42119.1 hypothetical protein [Tanacetum cinerariifolium]